MKRALLYWDVIWRIAPEGYQSLDPPTYWPSQPNDMRALEALEIVRQLAPKSVRTDALAKLWMDLLEEHGDDLAKRYRLDLDQRADLPDAATQGRGYSTPVRRKAGVGWLLTSKMRRELFDEMVRLGLAEDGATRGASGWFAFDDELLEAYMTSLANEILGDGNVETITDVPKHFRRFTANSVDALRETLLAEPDEPMAAEHDGVQVMVMAVETVHPAGVDAMPLGKVLEIRGSSSGPRAEFKAAMRAMVTDLQKLHDNKPRDAELAASDLAELKSEHIEKPLAELRKAMRGVYGEAVSSMLLLKNPLEAGTVGAAILTALGLSSGVLAAAGIALGAYQIFRNAKEAREELMKSQMAWLLDVEAKANAGDAVTEIVLRK